MQDEKRRNIQEDNKRFRKRTLRSFRWGVGESNNCSSKGRVQPKEEG